MQATAFLGAFDETVLSQEISMLDVNIFSVHILTKLFLKDFIQKTADIS